MNNWCPHYLHIYAPVCMLKKTRSIHAVIAFIITSNGKGFNWTMKNPKWQQLLNSIYIIIMYIYLLIHMYRERSAKTTISVLKESQSHSGLEWWVGGASVLANMQVINQTVYINGIMWTLSKPLYTVYIRILLGSGLQSLGHLQLRVAACDTNLARGCVEVMCLP